jgi:hypothetical protein
MQRTLFLAAFYLIANASSVWAALGQSADSILADQTSMSATLTTRNENGYLVYDLRAPSGMTVREFISPSGRVFAIAWEGPFFPDLSRLLGNYREHYREMQEKRPAGSINAPTEDATLVVQSSGHLRAFAGRAYLPADVPTGMTLEAIK